jgi:erythromycin esterase-like protein
MSELKPQVLGTEGKGNEYDELLERIGDSPIVMLGAASHGTREFYSERCRITKRLIEEQGFRMLAAVTDWADAFRVNRYVQGAPDDPDPEQALGDFRRFPTWVFRNREVLAFVTWLREHNEGIRYRNPVAFHGLDLYSFFQATARVIRYLESADPDAAERARTHFAQLGHLDMEPGHVAGGGLAIEAPDRRELLGELVQLQLRAQSYLRRDGTAVEDAEFYAEQHTRLAANAEGYYRMLLTDRGAAWREREQHMAETLSNLLENLERRGEPPRVVVWGHNSHVGDASVTELGERGEVSLGQLARERWPGEVALVGFTSYKGTVTASSTWAGAAEQMQVRPALDASYEALFHDLEHPRFYLDLGRKGQIAGDGGERLERAIGQVYQPERERESHFFSADISEQFDAVVHIDEATAVEPLD